MRGCHRPPAGSGHRSPVGAMRLQLSTQLRDARLDRAGPCRRRSGMKASAMTSRTMTPIRKNRNVARADDFVFDHPRARRLPTSGANEAATTSESSTETVTVPSRTASQIVTAARPEMARSRQLSAPRRRNHPGMTTVSAGTDAVTTLLQPWMLAPPRSPVSTVTGRGQDRPAPYLPAARASACSLIVANSSGVIAPGPGACAAFSISSAAESRV